MNLYEIDRNQSHHRANKLRTLYRDRDEARKHLNELIVSTDPDDEEIADFEAAIEAINQEINELVEDNPRVRESESVSTPVLRKELTVELERLDDAQNALSMLRRNSQTQSEYDRTDEYAKTVAAMERRVHRLQNRIKLRVAAGSILEHLSVEMHDEVDLSEVANQLTEAEERLSRARHGEQIWRDTRSPSPTSTQPTTPTDRKYFYVVGVGNRTIAGPFSTHTAAAEYITKHALEIPLSSKVLER